MQRRPNECTISPLLKNMQFECGDNRNDTFEDDFTGIMFMFDISLCCRKKIEIDNAMKIMAYHIIEYWKII